MTKEIKKRKRKEFRNKSHRNAEKNKQHLERQDADTKQIVGF